MAVGEGPGNGRVTLAKRSGLVGRAGDGPFAGVGRLGRGWQAGRALGNHVGQTGRISHRRSRVVDLEQLPWLSVKVQVMVVSPWPNGPVLSGVPVMAPSQPSVAVGAVGRLAEHWAITSGRLVASATGAVVSWTLTSCHGCR